ncbi:hypothetical protein [Kitasatospora fiedleri]|uniref:hypothetical protein n=1 Tax=Kitasatospora fiedleri TaxID=2991545 RepID=UPI00249A57EA|nr:hypothetical protein [Kitasatospora fiedleri]
MGILSRLARKPVQMAAAEAYKRGDAVFVHRFFATPQRLAELLAEVEALGWRVDQQHAEGTGRERAWTITCRRAES